MNKWNLWRDVSVSEQAAAMCRAAARRLHAGRIVANPRTGEHLRAESGPGAPDVALFVAEPSSRATLRLSVGGRTHADIPDYADTLSAYLYTHFDRLYSGPDLVVLITHMAGDDPRLEVCLGVVTEDLAAARRLAAGWSPRVLDLRTGQWRDLEDIHA